MVSKFRAGPNLDQRVAARYAEPAARRLADELAGALRANAPDALAWITAQDERVRRTHRDADGQLVPGNLRFVLDHPTSVDTDAGNGQNGDSGGGKELARGPRDPSLSIGNRINCRCLSVPLPGLIAERVSVGEPLITGSSARVTVSVAFPRIVESEHPGQGDEGGGWAARAMSEVASGGASRAH